MDNSASSWYEVENSDQVFSPSLLVYPERIQHNIDLMISVAGSSGKLVPHVKTHKMAEIVRMQMEAGIEKFKCATIAEAEMLADAGAKWILIAYQLVGPNVARLAHLSKKYPSVYLASLVDSLSTAQALNEVFSGTKSYVFIDINNGMNRSGHPVNEALFSMYQAIYELPAVELEGLHVYDGHIRDENLKDRTSHAERDFAAVVDFQKQLEDAGYPSPMIIAGGSPTFPVHAQRPGVYCSPGTSLLWDWGYGKRFTEPPFQHAAVLVTRVISKPTQGIVTIDLGHKAVSAENPIESRFTFLNLSGYEVLSQSEEHGVVKVKDWEAIQVGDLLYAIPYHICPTVALHEKVSVVDRHRAMGEWTVASRKRVISV